MGTDTAREERESVVAAAETALTPIAPLGDLPWAIVQMRAVEPIVVNEALIAAYQAASSPHSVRALRSDIEAFDAWCRRTQRIALPATPEMVADYLDARAGEGVGFPIRPDSGLPRDVARQIVPKPPDSG